MNFIYKIQSTFKIPLVLCLFNRKFKIKCVILNISNNILAVYIIVWSFANDVELDGKLAFTLMKIPWWHVNYYSFFSKTTKHTVIFKHIFYWSTDGKCFWIEHLRIYPIMWDEDWASTSNRRNPEKEVNVANTWCAAWLIISTQTCWPRWHSVTNELKPWS